MSWRIAADDDDQLGARMRAARKRAGLTLAEVASCTGRDTSTVCTWETGKRGLSLDDLAHYGACVHASISDLLGELPTGVTP